MELIEWWWSEYNLDKLRLNYSAESNNKEQNKYLKFFCNKQKNKSSKKIMAFINLHKRIHEKI